MTIFKKAQSPINSITLLVILLVSIETIISREIENEAIRDNLRFLKLKTHGRVLRAFVRPTNLSTAPYFGKRKDNLVTLRNIHLEQQLGRYRLDWFMELARKYPRIHGNHEWTVLNGHDNGHSTNRKLFTSIQVP